MLLLRQITGEMIVKLLWCVCVNRGYRGGSPTAVQA